MPRPIWKAANKDRVYLMAQLRTILQGHRGKKSAIRGGDLARQLGMNDDRQIRDCIASLVEDGLEVGSTTESPYGYFLWATVDESYESIRSLENRISADQKRLAYMKRNAKRTFGADAVPIQGSMM